MYASGMAPIGRGTKVPVVGAATSPPIAPPGSGTVACIGGAGGKAGGKPSTRADPFLHSEDDSKPRVGDDTMTRLDGAGAWDSAVKNRGTSFLKYRAVSSTPGSAFAVVLTYSA